MNYITHSFRYALSILEKEDEFRFLFAEIKQVLDSITDQALINQFNLDSQTKAIKSLSTSINILIKEKLVQLGWNSESYIFQDNEYRGETWRLDFAKETISIEVAFNHATVIAWNLLKPVLASELNHVQKAIQTKIGIVITATQNLKMAGGFDNAVGTFEKFIDYLMPLNNQLSVPILVIGLEAPNTFNIIHYRDTSGKNRGRINIF